MEYVDNNLAIAIVLAAGFSLASALGFLAQYLKLSPLVGYILAGCLIGPYSPFYDADIHLAEQLAEVGVILMMFGVGLHFKWQDLANVRHIALPGAIIQISLATLSGYIFMRFLGWDVTSSLILGISISVASAVVLVRVLKDNGFLKTQQGHIAVGWLVVEHLITVVALISLPSIASLSQGGSVSILNFFAEIGLQFIKFTLLVIFMLTLGSRLLTHALQSIARTRSQELLTLGILACVFALTVGSTLFFGISIALSALVTGMLIGKTQMNHEANAHSMPIQSAFIALFFISVGMLLNPAIILTKPLLFLGVLALIMLVKPLIAWLILRLFKQSLYSSFAIALSLAQIGEFSFILAEEALHLKLLAIEAYDLLVACAIVSISLNQMLFTWLKSCREFLKENVPHPSHKLPEKFISSEKKAVVIGYGLSGKKATSMLLKQDFSVIVIDHDIDSITSLAKENKEKIHALYGDATQITLLEHAKLDEAKLVIITAADPYTTKMILNHVREINPNIHTIARVNYQRDCELFENIKVEIVCNEQEAVNAFEKTIMDLVKEV